MTSPPLDGGGGGGGGGLAILTLTASLLAALSWNSNASMDFTLGKGETLLSASSDEVLDWLARRRLFLRALWGGLEWPRLTFTTGIDFPSIFTDRMQP